jgi:hypothetical protein
LALLIIGRRIQDGKERKERKRMKKEEKKEMIINIAEKLTALAFPTRRSSDLDIDKSYLVGYMAGKTEERQKWVQREAAKASAS